MIDLQIFSFKNIIYILSHGFQKFCSFWRKMAMGSIPTYVTMYLAIKIILFT